MKQAKSARRDWSSSRRGNSSQQEAATVSGTWPKPFASQSPQLRKKKKKRPVQRRRWRSGFGLDHTRHLNTEDRPQKTPSDYLFLQEASAFRTESNRWFGSRIYRAFLSTATTALTRWTTRRSTKLAHPGKQSELVKLCQNMLESPRGTTSRSQKGHRIFFFFFRTFRLLRSPSVSQPIQQSQLHTPTRPPSHILATSLFSLFFLQH